MVSYRVSTTTWESDYHFDNLMTLLEKYKNDIDEIALFTGFVHTCLPIERVERMCQVAKDRIERIKALGISCGINHLCTVGHINENKAHSLDFENYDCQTDTTGYKANVLCFSSPKTYQYAEKVYTAIAIAEPDFVWVDDDFRTYGHGRDNAFYGCFCPLCMEKFGKFVNIPNMSKELFFELTEGDQKAFYRQKWLEFNEFNLISLLKFIRETVDKVNPNIIMGMMSADHNYANECMKSMSEAMSGPNHLPIKWRPGGGFYQDFDKRGLYEKATALGKQAVHYLDICDDIQSEIENFPYNHLHKSAKMNVIETCAYIGVGCNGVAYNALYPDNDKTLYNSAPENDFRFSKILSYKPFFEELSKTFGKNYNKGVYCFENNKTTFIGMNWFDRWLSGYDPGSLSELYQGGIPQAYKSTGCTMLLKDNFRALKREEILKILSGGVILSGDAFKALLEMGYGEYLGFKISRSIEDDGIECFTDHKFNEDFAYAWRDCRQSFKWWAKPCYGMTKTDPKAEALGYLVDYANIPWTDDQGRELYTMGLYENSLGGRVCIMTYFPETYLQAGNKQRQLKNILKYVSRNSVSYVSSYHNIYMFDRSGDRVGILLINMSYDDAENVIINFAKDVEKITLVFDDMTEKCVTRCNYEEGYSVFNIGNIKSFDMCLIKE